MSSTTAYRSYLNGFSDLARTCKFLAFFTVPNGLQVNGLSSPTTTAAQVPQGLALQCESAELPGRTLATHEYRTYGPSRKVAFQTAYNEMSMTFYCTGNPVNLSTLLTSFVTGQVTNLLGSVLGGGIATEIGDVASGLIQNMEGGQGTNNGGMWERQFFDDWMDYIHPVETTNLGNLNYPSDYMTNITVCHYDPQNNATVAYKYVDAFPIAIQSQTLNWSEDAILLVTVTFAFWKVTRASTLNLDSFTVLNPISGLVDSLVTSATGSSTAGRVASDLISTSPLTNILNGI